MVAYSFHARFVAPIERGLVLGPRRPGMKRHTIRADRKRHAREGEEMQLYQGMRTKHCRLLGRPVCTVVRPITLIFNDADDELEGIVSPGGIAQWGYASLDDFADGDGFADWQELKAFWRIKHVGVDEFAGVIIFWEPKA